MPSYVILGNWTSDGIRSIRQAPERAEAFRKTVEAGGGRVISLLYTMGAHDFVTLVEFPSDEAANTAVLRAASQGSARTTTLKGWSPEEFSRLVAKL